MSLLLKSTVGMTVIAGFWLLAVATANPETTNKVRRKGKYFDIFQVIRFANDQCEAGLRNGTCYTEQECESRGGTNSGSCADGFGVCCTFTLSCGEMSSENCTYFESDSAPTAGGCSAKICPANNNICQLRLDFLSFQIAGPSTSTSFVGFIDHGVQGRIPGVSASAASRCLTDSFVVTGATNRASDVICGVNTGQHLYVEVNKGCLDLSFMLGPESNNRNWNIVVKQYGCESPVRAPAGCTQYFYGQSSAIVESFNFNGGNGYHLANQDQNVCVRRERGNCRICWYTTNAGDFALSGSTGQVAIISTESVCGGFGNNGLDNMKGYDHINVAGAKNPMLTTFVKSNLCGRTTAANRLATSICSVQTPFLLNFRSDAWELAGTLETMGDNGGLRLEFTQDSINC